MFGKKKKKDNFRDLTGQQVNPIVQPLQQVVKEPQQLSELPEIAPPVEHPHTRALLDMRNHLLELIIWIDKRIK